MEEKDNVAVENEAVENSASAPEYKGFAKKLDNYFEITARKSSIRTEIIAGLTTFFAMAYIIVVNPNQITGFNNFLGGAWQGIWNAVFVGGIIAAIIGTMLYALLAKLPFAQAAGMGLNSFFFVSFLLPALLSGGAISPDQGYGAGLVIILISGVVFLVLSVTGAREYIAKALPDCLKKAIPAGIGLFIALIGMKNSFIITANQYTFVQLGDLTKWTVYNDFGELAGGAAPFLAAFIGFILIAVFAKSKIGWLRKGSIILGILASTILYYLLTWTLPVWSNGNIGTTFADFGKYGLSVFKAESWAGAFNGTITGGIFSSIMLIITFCLVDMFDTIGTLYGTASQAGMLDENGDPININKAMMSDSIATVAGAMLGTSTVTTYVESSAGVAEGGRTGLTSVVVSLCFLLCLFVSPIASLIPTVATAPALIFVGVLMLKNFSSVDMNDLRSAVPAFLALLMMPLTYSISNGIGVGTIAYVLITLLTGKYTKRDIVVTVIAALFLARFFLQAM